MLLLAQMGGKICETWIDLQPVAQSACEHAAEVPSCPITLRSKDALCSALCSGFGDGAKAVRGPWVPLAGLAPPVARHKDHKAWCQLTLPSIPLRVWKYPGSPSWALVPSKTCLQCTSACMHCSKKKKSHRCPSALDQPIPFLPMQKICRVFTQAKNEHGYTWKLYALIRRGKKKTRKRLKDSAKQPTSSDPKDFGVKMNRGFSGFILFCVILLCSVLWRRRAGNVVKDEPNESAWKKNVVSFFIIEDWWILSWY